MRKTMLSLVAICMLVVTGVQAAEIELSANSESTTVSVEPNALCKAVMQGDVDTVKKLIESGEDVNRRSLGMAPIHFAARYNQAEILELLIENGAKLNKRCSKGYTAKKHAEMSNATESLAVIETAMKK
ncbi:ankyrin repeat domain-containing protein [Muricauda sp. JGD-17]|uniref:Ankyrin repeat domain-containing protein n=1 Tax=Flagellimonas ochracea TaxID=2696472 RepID=A0A964TCT2_9FLAO|nr:ankyrin repeat domain-containing protein [Allomuricauda ochracea]NAY92465.1 ankyrin repeat domain-containing protein [Allomuricauda ochracea]